VIVPGPRNALTDVAGLRVGHAQDRAAMTGVTVILGDAPLRAAVDVRGGAPGTINTDALAPGGLVGELHGLVLSGGSTFGLEAATGLMSWLAGQGVGFRGWGPTIPFVAGAILFDLANGGDKGWGDPPPYRRLARAAAEAAGPEVAQGTVGAGTGATAGPLKGGIGTASAVDPATGITLAALVAVNSLGGVTHPGQATFWCWHLEQAGELGGQRPPQAATGHAFETKRGLGQALPPGVPPATATTIGVLATDADLDRALLRRLAIHAQAGLAAAIRPIHTLFDGDVMIAVGTADAPVPARADLMIRLGALAADVTARAVMRGVYEASDLGAMRSWRTVWASP
jgi:L-aminopeptidase/D-esterase-like protein